MQGVPEANLHLNAPSPDATAMVMIPNMLSVSEADRVLISQVARISVFYPDLHELFPLLLIHKVADALLRRPLWLPVSDRIRRSHHLQRATKEVLFSDVRYS
jgi:hypothetical protein